VPFEVLVIVKFECGPELMCHRLVVRCGGTVFVIGSSLDQANALMEVFGGNLLVQYESVHLYHQQLQHRMQLQWFLFRMLVWMKMIRYIMWHVDGLHAIS
jgi:hypothetical protein